MTDQNNDDQTPEEDHGENLRTVRLAPTHSGIIRNEDREPLKPRERSPSQDNGFNALLIANQHTYRRNNVRDAIDYIMKRDPLAIPFFETALADYVTDEADAAAGG